MCIGRVWDAVTNRYHAKHPIPPVVLSIYRRALEQLTAEQKRSLGITERPEQCMVNYYTQKAVLSLHDEKYAKGAVISISIGDTGR